MLRRAQSTDKGRAGKAHEKSLAKRIGADLTPGSGALDGAKGDMKKGDFLIEAKTSTRESFTVKRDVLHKIRGEAMAIGKYPALAVSFVNEEGKSTKNDRWVMLTEQDFLDLIEPRE